ncbi:MAG: RNA polymerase sigma factor [Burkholderiales bacterium]|nr:RNA polymerase sigma factor [Burkholderiales bacterium]
MFTTQAMQYIPRLRRYARALTGDASAADDLVQDALERALVKRDLWREGSDLRAWLFTVMHNVFVNQVRSAAATRTVPLEVSAADLPQPQAGDRLEIRDLDVALQALPEEQRAVLLLVGLEQMSYDEAARVLDVPIGTVMSRLSRGRERLRRLLQGLPDSNAPLKVVK